MRVLAGLLLFAGLAAGQTPDTIPAAATQPGPTTHGWPTTASPTVPPAQPSGAAATETRLGSGAPVPQFRPPAGFPPEPPNYPQPADGGSAPLPGSLADDFAREYAFRQQQRACDYLGNRYTVFPTSLLWAPPLADKRSPRLAAEYSQQDSVSGNAFDASFGQTLGLLRADRNGVDGSFQLDAFAAAFARFDGSNLVVADFRGGIPLTFRRGDWFGKLAYEHTSSFLGDNILTFPRAAGLGDPRPRYRKDEIVLGLGHWFDDRVRVYGQAAYAFSFTLDEQLVYLDGGQSGTGDDRKQRYQIGAEWFPWGLTGRFGQPFAAINADFRGENGFSGDVTVQGGWLWRNPYQRLASLRLYVEYYSGHSQYGQFSRSGRDSYAGVGVAADY